MKYILRFLLLVIVVSSSTLSWGQKVKYKDLFFLIHKSKKYEDGEPFLRSFLRNPKNANHANANFQMGVIHELNAGKKDVLTESKDKGMLLDSAVYFYAKSKSLITDKEVRKNSDYYEDDFLRRDLRTGKMGIKVSDVQLYMDDRVNKLNERILDLKSIDHHFYKSKDEYQKAFELYAELVNKYQSQRVFYLRADDEVISQCSLIKTAYDSAMGNFGEYKIIIAKIESSDYNQSLNVLKIEDIKADGDKMADFYAASIDVYDFAHWADRESGVIKDHIRPLKKKLIAYDQRLNKTREKLFKDSVSVVAMMKLERDDKLYEELSMYDERAMPLRLLDLKQEELTYWSFIFGNKKDKDSTNIAYQVEMATSELEAINGVDSLSNVLLGYDLTSEGENYLEYISSQYEGVAGLQRYVKQKLNFAQAEKKYRATILEAKIERSRWLMYGNDSIPLFQRDSTLQLASSSDKTQYIRLGESMPDNPVQFTYGIKYEPTRKGSAYVSAVPDSLSVTTIASYKLDAVFTIDRFQSLGAQSVHDQALKLTYILYYDRSPFEQKHKKAQLTCVNAGGHVLWSKALGLVYPPDKMTLYDKGGVSINYDVKYIDTTNTAKLVSRLLVGTDGKVLN